MNLYLLFLLFLLGGSVGFLSGLLGIGGGILLAPLLLYLPPLLQAGSLDMKEVSGLTMVQSLFATFSGAIVHKKFKYVNRNLVLSMGISIAFASFAGAVISRWISSRTLIAIFATMALIAAAMMFIPIRDKDEGVECENINFNRKLAVIVSLIIGVFGGMVGQSGAFIIVPAMIYILRIPMRITIGSSLGIVFCAALSGTVGKLSVGHIPLKLAVATVSGGVIGARLGAYVSVGVKIKWLKILLTIIIALTAIKMLYEIVFSG